MSFAATAVTNLAVNNPATVILLRATLVMIACYIVGYVIGLIAQHTMNQHIQDYKKQNPIPDPDAVEPPTELEFDEAGAPTRDIQRGAA